MTAQPHLVILDIGARQVFTTDENGKRLDTLQKGLDMIPDGIIVSPDLRHIYFTQMGKPDFETESAMAFDGTISRMNMDGSELTQLVGDGKIRTPKQITADWQSAKLYWSDREGLRVMRCNLDGSDVETLVQSGHVPQDENDQTRWCVGITVDPVRRQFYWTQKGSPDGGKGRIFRAGYDLPAGETPANRSDIEVLFSDLPEPIDLELTETHLYWTDRGDLPGGNSVCRAAIAADGTLAREREVLATGIGEAIGLAVDHAGRRIYATSLEGRLYRMGLNGSGLEKIGNFSHLTGLARLPQAA
ncbi:MAG: 3-hydroxyacyl-CoA dehydrogenase [Hyphomicrobiaceae bacterium]